MKKSKYMIIPCAALIVSILAIITTIVAWYVVIDQSKDLQFEILQIDSQVTLYEGVDSNQNGVPNKLTTANKYYNVEVEGDDKYVEYTNMYYNENYEFSYVDQKYALSQDSSSNLFSTIVINDAAPSKIYTYKFEVINYVQAANDFDFTFEVSNFTGSLTELKNFDVRLGLVKADGSIVFCDWTKLTDGTTKIDVNLKPEGSRMAIPAHSNKTGTTTPMSVGRTDVWLQVRVNSETTTTVDKFVLPQYRLTFEFES